MPKPRNAHADSFGCPLAHARMFDMTQFYITELNAVLSPRGLHLGAKISGQD